MAETTRGRGGEQGLFRTVDNSWRTLDGLSTDTRGRAAQGSVALLW